MIILTCGPTGGERKLEGRKVIGVTSPHELSSPLVLLISACIIIGHLIVSFLTSSHVILTHLISFYHSLFILSNPSFSYLILHISSRSISSPLISPHAICSYPMYSHLSSSYTI